MNWYKNAEQDATKHTRLNQWCEMLWAFLEIKTQCELFPKFLFISDPLGHL